MACLRGEAVSSGVASEVGLLETQQYADKGHKNLAQNQSQCSQKGRGDFKTLHWITKAQGNLKTFCCRGKEPSSRLLRRIHFQGSANSYSIQPLQSPRAHKRASCHWENLRQRRHRPAFGRLSMSPSTKTMIEHTVSRAAKAFHIHSFQVVYRPEMSMEYQRSIG